MRPQPVMLYRLQLDSPFHQNFSASDTSASMKKTVLICDDDIDLLRVYRLALRSRYNIFTASSGNECVEKFSEMIQSGRKVDALLLDYRLGDTSGDKVAKRVKDLDGAKVVLISAYEIDDSLVSELKGAGYISLFVKKPMTLSALAVAIETALSM
jgi:DNA-binding NtrC family response regulator